MKILWINSSSAQISFWRIEQISRYIFDNFREESPLGEPVFPHVEYFFDPGSGIAWDHFIQHHQTDETAKMIYDSIEQAFVHFDVIICQALGYKWGLNRLLEMQVKYNKPLFMELDDIFDEMTPSNYHSHRIRDHYNIQAKQAKASYGIITTNKYLANKMKKYNENVFVLPNLVYDKLWVKGDDPSTKRPFVNYAYVGGGGHDEDLKILYRAMVPLLDDGVKFGIYYGGYRPEFLKEHENLFFENWHYHISDYYKELLRIDCNMFVAPLRDTEFNRCKSDIKIIEAKMCGKNIICSNVEPYKKHNKNYLTSNDTDEWGLTLAKHRYTNKKTNLTKKHKIEESTMDFLFYLQKVLK